MLPLIRRLARLLDLGILFRVVVSPLDDVLRLETSGVVVSLGVNWWPFDKFWAVYGDIDEVVTESAEVEVSACDDPTALPAGIAPGVGLVPASDPLVEVAELCTPPALAELKEYIEDVDMRFPSFSAPDAREFKAASGNEGCLDVSAMIPAANLGVSKSSMADSGRGLPVPPVQTSEFSEGRRWLNVDEGRDLMVGRAEGGGIEILARSAWASVVPGSA